MADIVPVPDPSLLTTEALRREIAWTREITDDKFKAFRDLHDVLERRFSQVGADIDAAILNYNNLCLERRAGIEQEIKGYRDAIVDQLKGVDLRLTTLQQQVETVDNSVRRFYDEKFRVVEAQTARAAVDTKVALDMAFDSVAAMAKQQNEATTAASQKQEAAFTKQIDQLSVNASQVTKAFDDKLDDLKKTLDDKFTDMKDRIVVMESRSSIIDPTTGAALRDMAQTIAVLKQSNDHASGAYRQRTDSTAWIFSAIAAAVAIAVLAMDFIRTAH